MDVPPEETAMIVKPGQVGATVNPNKERFQLSWIQFQI